MKREKHFGLFKHCFHYFIFSLAVKRKSNKKQAYISRLPFRLIFFLRLPLWRGNFHFGCTVRLPLSLFGLGRVTSCLLITLKLRCIHAKWWVLFVKERTRSQKITLTLNLWALFSELNSCEEAWEKGNRNRVPYSLTSPTAAIPDPTPPPHQPI